MAAAVDLGGALGGSYRTFRRQQLGVVCITHNGARRVLEGRESSRLVYSLAEY